MSIVKLVMGTIKVLIVLGAVEILAPGLSHSIAKELTILVYNMVKK